MSAEHEITMRAAAGVCEVPLKSWKYPGLLALVDEDDAALVGSYGWYPQRERTGRFVPVSAGGLIMARLITAPPPGSDVCHEDGDGLNNRRANLVVATRTERGTSGYRGVTWDHGKGKWKVLIRVEGKQRRIGRFTDPAEAARAYDRAARQYHGDTAVLNFPANDSEALVSDEHPESLQLKARVTFGGGLNSISVTIPGGGEQE